MNTTQYILRVPIHGYSGMGYESQSHFTKTFTDKEAALKWYRRYTKAWELTQRQATWSRGDPISILWNDREEEFMREMDDNVSFSIEGPPILSRATTVEEPIMVDETPASVEVAP